MRQSLIISICIWVLLTCSSCIFDNKDDNQKEFYLSGTIKDTSGNVITDASVYIVFDEFSENKGINDSLSVPVQFFVYLSENNGATVVWRTETESNMSGFIILRAGCNDIDSSVVITGLIPATNTHYYQSYGYVDYNLNAGRYYYWLKAIETDNTFDIYGPAYYYHIVYHPPTEWAIYACPNPMTTRSWICYDTPESCNVKINISSPYKGLIRTIEQDSLTPTNHMFRFDAVQMIGDNFIALCNGLYQATITATNPGGDVLYNNTINLFKNDPDLDFYNVPVTYSASNGYSIPFNKYFQFGKQFAAYNVDEWSFTGNFAVEGNFTIYIAKEGYQTISRHVTITNYKSNHKENFVLHHAESTGSSKKDIHRGLEITKRRIRSSRG